MLEILKNRNDRTEKYNNPKLKVWIGRSQKNQTQLRM
jgi:hypothetical protein